MNDDSPIWSKISHQTKDLIQKLLLKDPKERLTIDQALKHPAFE